MQLRIRRSQRSGGVLGNTVIFCLDAQAAFTLEEDENIRRYKLHNQCIYNSEASLRAQERGNENLAKGTIGGSLKAIGHYAIAHMRLNITINSLSRGQHIECKSLDELLGAEDALYEACRNLRSYLDTAATFDGREVVIAFDSEEPKFVASATPQQTLVATPTPVAALPAAALAAPAAAPVAEVTIPDAQPAAEPTFYEPAPEATSAYAPSYGQVGVGRISFFSEGAQGAKEKKILIGIAAVLAVILLFSA